jgi:hypothetical protein
MGIRFRCPNGHKLHVKAFLAGMRGVCPDCGIKVAIPLTSDAEFDREIAEPKPARMGGRPADHGALPSLPRIDVRGNRRSESLADGSATVATTTSPPQVMARAAGESPESSADPVSAAPQAQWFVRPPTGGQFGPANGALLKTWLAEGRITADSYLWRQGWTEWKRAETVFPPLRPLNVAEPEEVPVLRMAALGTTLEDAPRVVDRAPTPAIVDPSHASSALSVYRRRKSKRRTVTMTMLLGIACVIVAAALVYVLWFIN